MSPKSVSVVLGICKHHDTFVPWEVLTQAQFSLNAQGTRFQKQFRQIHHKGSQGESDQATPEMNLISFVRVTFRKTKSG